MILSCNTAFGVLSSCLFNGLIHSDARHEALSRWIQEKEWKKIKGLLHHVVLSDYI